MKRTRRLALLVAAATLASVPAEGAEILEYAEPDGAVKTVQVVRVLKDEEDELDCRILVGGRSRRLELPPRRVIRFRRGDPDAVNQWSKRLDTGKRMLASGQLATQGTVPGAEETFMKIAYTTEKGVKGEEEAYEAHPWHNMYALFYLIETRLRMGLAGDTSKLEAALANVEEFKKRSATKRTLKLEAPGEKGATRSVEVYCWGDTRLMPQVRLLEARILAALGRKEDAVKVFDALIDDAKKGSISPLLLASAFVAKAEVEAAGEPSEKQESIYRAAGSVLSTLARSQPDTFGREVLTRAANQALLKGADLLRESAAANKVTWDTPLSRYQALKSGEGQRDPALYIGAQAGIGACLVEKGQGEQAYEALLEVVVKGSEYPDQMALALYYMGRAARLFADEIEAAGGKGEFLRSEAARWWSDLKERYPTSRWAEKVQAQ